MGSKKLELAAKMAQDASKSGFQEALEASWGQLKLEQSQSWEVVFVFS